MRPSQRVAAVVVSAALSGGLLFSASASATAAPAARGDQSSVSTQADTMRAWKNMGTYWFESNCRAKGRQYIQNTVYSQYKCERNANNTKWILYVR